MTSLTENQKPDAFADVLPLRLPDGFLATAESAAIRELGYLAIMSFDDGGSKTFTRRECVALKDWLQNLVSHHDE